MPVTVVMSLAAAGMDVVCGPTLRRLLNFSVCRHHFRVVNINIAMFFSLLRGPWNNGPVFGGANEVTPHRVY